jgi:hypothetical protein
VRRRARLRFVDIDDLPRESAPTRELHVRNHLGDDLGSVDGFVVEQSSGRPVYYVIDSGGWFIGRRYLVPIGKGRLDSATQNLIIDLDREKLHRYPEFNTNAFMTMNDEQVRAYERRIMGAINPAAAREGRYWESYDRLPEYTPPEWLAVTSWTTSREAAASASDERQRAAGRRSRVAQPDRELITARDDTSTVVEGQQSHPSEGVRGIVEEVPRKKDDERIR